MVLANIHDIYRGRCVAAHRFPSSSSAYKLLRGPPKVCFQFFIIVDSFDMLSYTTQRGIKMHQETVRIDGNHQDVAWGASVHTCDVLL